MTDGQVIAEDRGTRAPSAPLASIAVAVVFGAALAGCAYAGDVALLVATAVLQALFVAAWFVVVAPRGRRGVVPVLVLAAAAADVAVAHWPHARLGTLLPVLGLALPALFVHQLTRGVSRVQLVESLAASSLATLTVIALPSFLQLRHEFATSGSAGKVVLAVVGAAAAGLAAALLADLVVPAPRFDPAVPRGLAAFVVAAVVGGSVGYLAMRDDIQFAHARAAFVGVCCGLLVALFSVASDFAVLGLGVSDGRQAAFARPVFAVLLALSLVAPAAFLVCLAVRT